MARRPVFFRINRRWAAAIVLPALVCAAVIYGAPRPQAATVLDLSGYALTFDESFLKLNVSAIGPGTRWIAHTPWHGDFGDAVFDNPGPDGPFLSGVDGLSIVAHKDKAGHWHSGLLCSMDSDGPGQHGFAQRYGYFEMKAKLPSGSGTWPAFWLIGVNKSKTAAEIDVVEYYGGFDRYFHSVEHVWEYGNDRLHLNHLTQVPPGLLSRQFNTYGVLIGPDQTSFYFNRALIWSTPTPPEYQQPMYMLVNLAIGGGWPENTLLSPEIMQVKYIRVFQRETSP
jgi:hypothetical protein